MKNLRYYNDSTIDFHKKVVDSKNNTRLDPDYKSRLLTLNEVISDKFDTYDDLLAENKLLESAPIEFSIQNKKDLLKLYSFKSKVINDLKIKLTSTEFNRISNTCQNCTINEVNSFDHVLPKEEFTEYVVNPKNLFPCCTECNSYKGTSYEDGGKPLFLNLYLDELPNEQYLFVNIDFNGGDIMSRFHVRNDGVIDEDLFDIIESHYTKLHLFQRFCENSNSVISELVNTIKPNINVVTKEQMVTMITNKIRKDREVFGYNYWKSILELALMENEEFMEWVFEND